VAKILLVEDDEGLARRLKVLLSHERHSVDVLDNGEDALQQLGVTTYDAIILDWKLPGLSGIDVCKEFRERGGVTPVMILTGKSAISEKTAGLDSGADDYVTKPVNTAELYARIRALLRRNVGFASKMLKAGDLTLEPDSHIVTRSGVEIELSPKEFQLLEFFMRHPNTVFSADALLDRVWRTDSEQSSHTVRTHMQRLRGKIDLQGQPSVIQTVAGVGYKLKV